MLLPCLLPPVKTNGRESSAVPRASQGSSPHIVQNIKAERRNLDSVRQTHFRPLKCRNERQRLAVLRGRSRSSAASSS